MTKQDCTEKHQNKQPLTKKQIKEIANIPLVYALISRDRGVFYVGKTINLHKRIQSYTSPNQCHNKEMAEYLRANDFGVIVLDENPVNLNESEISYIKKYSGQTFNRMTVPYEKWMVKTKKPWNAGTGVKCPSDYLMSRVARNKGVKKSVLFSDLLKVIAAMSVKERIAFEVDTYRCESEFVQSQMRRWVDTCQGEMLRALLAD